MEASDAVGTVTGLDTALFEELGQASPLPEGSFFDVSRSA